VATPLRGSWSAIGWGLLTAALCGCATSTPHARPAEAPALSAAGAEVRASIQGLSSKDPAVRARSAWSLAGAEELQSEARAALRRLRTDDEKTVRYAAEWALTHLRKGEDEPDLAQPQANEGNWTPPKATESPRPQYPEAALTSKVEGTVLVEILIGEEGEVAHAEIRQSIPALDAAALAAVRQWKFQPALVDGAPRAAVAQVPVAFRID
jgi:TonB family protein